MATQDATLRETGRTRAGALAEAERSRRNAGALGRHSRAVPSHGCELFGFHLNISARNTRIINAAVLGWPLLGNNVDGAAVDGCERLDVRLRNEVLRVAAP